MKREQGPTFSRGKQWYSDLAPRSQKLLFMIATEVHASPLVFVPIILYVYLSCCPWGNSHNSLSMSIVFAPTHHSKHLTQINSFSSYNDPRRWALFGSQIFRFLGRRLWNQALETAWNFIQANLGAELRALVMHDLTVESSRRKKKDGDQKKRWEKWQEFRRKASEEDEKKGVNRSGKGPGRGITQGDYDQNMLHTCLKVS